MEYKVHGFRSAGFQGGIRFNMKITLACKHICRQSQGNQTVLISTQYIPTKLNSSLLQHLFAISRRIQDVEYMTMLDA